MPPLYRKLLAVTVMTLGLLLPQTAIEDLVEERRLRQNEAAVEFERDWAPHGEVRGPLLSVPTRSLTNDGQWTVTGRILLRPRELTVDGRLDAETRYRGIFRAPVYQAKLELAGTFAVPETGEKGQQLDLDWAKARLHVFLSRVDMLTEPGTLEAAGASARMSIGNTLENYGAGVASVSAVLPGMGYKAGQDLPFKVTLHVKGGEAFYVAPFAESVQARLTSNWPAPSFRSGWLPEQHEITEEGFKAEFRAQALAREVDLMLESSRQDPWAPKVRTFGVTFYDPASHYVQINRAVKYAVLFVVLTFLTFFLFELLSGLRLHPVQYLTVGAALVMFFLLLLSLSEQIGFGLAYLASALGVIGIVTGYARTILASGSRSVAVGAGLSSLYGFLFVLLQLESYSLVFGSLALFALLAAFMFLTRRVNWYDVAPGRAKTVTPAATP